MLKKLNFDLDYVKDKLRIERIQGSFSNNVLVSTPKKVQVQILRFISLKEKLQLTNLKRENPFHEEFNLNKNPKSKK